MHDLVLDQPDSHAPEDAAQPQPTVNGSHKADTLEPTTNVSSGIEGVAQFLPDSQTDNNSLFGSESGVPSITNAVEAPTSDVRDEAGPDPITQQAESTQKVPETQLAAAEEPSGGPVQSDAMELSQDGPDASGTAADSSAPPTNSMTELTIETQQSTASPSQMPMTQSPTNLDQEMEDAPSSGKVRPREDDDVDAPEAKRTKTEEDTVGEVEFKVPELPAHVDDVNGSAPTSAHAQEPSSVQEAATYEEWPSSPINTLQHRFLIDRIRNTKKIKVSAAFKEPVDPVALNIPQYPELVKNPMDLGTMENKLKEGRYTHVREFMEDLDLIVNNSVLFNGKDHPVTQAGYNLRAYFLKGMGKMPREGVEEPAKQAKAKKPSVPVATKPRRESRTAPTTAKSPTAPTPTAASPQTAWPLNADGTPLIRRDSSSANNDRPKREIHRPPSKDLPYATAKPRKKKYQQELKFCESVIAEIMKPKYAKCTYPFIAPVDPVALNIPSYLKIIKKPMDFGTIEKNLKAGAYQSAKDFYNDAQLVFANCYKFNPEGDDVHKAGKQLNELFNKLWEEKAEWLAQHAPEAEPPSPGSAYSDEEEEEEEEDPAQAQFLAIQKQIQALNETAQQLLQQQKGKRASPKASSKKKTKAATQPKKKHAPLSVPPPAAKPGRAKPRAKAPAPLSYTQKQEISDGISTLGDADMRRAVQIIKNGCPNLANANEDEMELDMDEINDDTLRELFRFIKSVRGPKASVPDDDYDPPRPAPRQPTASRPKKNKPMGKSEQEENLRRIQEKMNSFHGAVSGSSQSPPGRSSVGSERVAWTNLPLANHDESSDDESSASESEEE